MGELSEGWIEWNGGAIPVDPESLVMVIYKSGEWSHAPAAASTFQWGHQGTIEDIKAYQTVM